MIRRKRNIIEMAVATAIFGACAAGAMPVSHAGQSAAAAGDNGGQAAATTDQDQTATPPANSPGGESEQLQEVVVTGIRAAIQSAIRLKEMSDDITETISAEDIGKLPDVSIAESLARLPGVTTQRDSQGNATSISIRGLGPDFNGYLLNGREQTSTLDSRAVDLSVYPAELISGATVYKSGDASLMTAGLAGTVDMRLIDPLRYDKLIAQGTYEPDRYNEGVPGAPIGKGKRYTLSFIDQFFDRKLGIAIGFVHTNHNSTSLNDSTWGNTNYTAISPSGANLGQAQFIGGFNYITNAYSEKRDGGAVILKFKPNDVYTTELDTYYAKLYLNQGITEAQAGFAYGNPSVSTITNATVANGIIDSGSIGLTAYTPTAAAPAPPGYGLIDRNEAILDEDTIQSFGWNHRLDFADGWGASLDLNHNRAQRIERDNESYATIDGAETLSFTNGAAAVNGGVPHLTLGAPYTDPSTLFIHSIDGWSGITYPSGQFAGDQVPQAGYSKGPTITDTLNAVRLDFDHALAFGPFSKVDLGANYSDRQKKYITDEGLIVSTNPGGYGDIHFPSGAGVVNDVGGSGLSFLSFSPSAELWPGATILPKYNDDILSKTWTVKELVTTGYGKLDITTQWFGIPVRGNLGLQWVHTDQSSQGYRANVNSSPTLSNPALSLSEAGTSYNDVLPSLNLIGNFGDGNLLRFSASEQIARPDMTDMRNSLAVSLDTNSADPTYNTLVGSAGNPYLKPFKATALDLSYEKYFSTRAYLGAALFYKRLNTYITQYTNYGGYDFTQLAKTVGLAIPPRGPDGTFTEQINGHGGNIRGLELSASVPFGMVTSWLDGFGITGSYSSTLSSVVVPNTIGLNPAQQVPLNLTMPLPNLSHINEKVIFYFEKWGFSAFIADNKRSKYIGSVANQTVGGYPALVYIQPQTWVSAQVGYEFQSGWLQGLGIRFEGTNLNKPKYKTVQAFGGPLTTVQTGANYDLRFTYKFEH
ncbi:MAG: TonB-dependent receptor [Gammaproteobacteria bacterium]|nr:TonB-dependent receptor [Gammaproteobacteria bacterium]